MKVCASPAKHANSDDDHDGYDGDKRVVKRNEGKETNFGEFCFSINYFIFNIIINGSFNGLMCGLI